MYSLDEFNLEIQFLELDFCHEAHVERVWIEGVSFDASLKLHDLLEKDSSFGTMDGLILNDNEYCWFMGLMETRFKGL